jgi:intein/homing endonuclease
MKIKNFQKIKAFSSENKILNSYILGLFRADGYTRTGTFGVTNRNPEILKRAGAILSNFGQAKWIADEKGPLRVYVSSRPRKREFDRIMQQTERKLTQNKNLIAAYFAGKYDGDGSYWKKERLRFKITYGKPKDFLSDQKLLLSLGISSIIREYKNANAFDLEISSSNALAFFGLIRKFSIKCPLGTTKFVP